MRPTAEVCLSLAGLPLLALLTLLASLTCSLASPWPFPRLPRPRLAANWLHSRFAAPSPTPPRRSPPLHRLPHAAADAGATAMDANLRQKGDGPLQFHCSCCPAGPCPLIPRIFSPDPSLPARRQFAAALVVQARPRRPLPTPFTT